VVKKHLIILIGFLFLVDINVSAQLHNITIQITNQPNTDFIIGSIKRNKFLPIDTTQPINNSIHFQLPTKTQPGIYRIILGQTTYAKVINEPPQQLDFI